MSRRATIDHIEIPSMSIDKNTTLSPEAANKDSTKRLESYSFTNKEVEKKYLS